MTDKFNPYFYLSQLQNYTFGYTDNRLEILPPWRHDRQGGFTAAISTHISVYWYKMAAASAESTIGKRVCYHSTGLGVLLHAATTPGTSS
jgi:hypothetical protein